VPPSRRDDTMPPPRLRWRWRTDPSCDGLPMIAMAMSAAGSCLGAVGGFPGFVVWGSLREDPSRFVGATPRSARSSQWPAAADGVSGDAASVSANAWGMASSRESMASD